MKRLTILAIALFSISVIRSQATLTSAQMLAKSCEVWGYVKYFHSSINGCDINWDSVLIAHIPAIKNAVSDDAFNTEIQSLIDAAGEMALPLTEPDEPVEPFLHNLDFFWVGDTIFNDEIKSSLDTIRARYRSKSNCHVRLNDYADPDEIGWFLFTNENNDIPSPEFPSEEYRLLIMFRYWNVVNYFHAYRDLDDIPWKESLVPAITECINATDQLSWLKSLRRLSAATNDAHSFFSSLNFSNLFYGGISAPAFKAQRVEDQVVVVDSWLPAMELKPGDIIHAVNGISVEVLIDSFGRFKPHCTDASWYRDLCNYIFIGPEADMVIDAENETGDFTVTIPRDQSSIEWNQHYYPTWNYDEYFITDCGYGYVNMEKLTTGHITAMLDEFEETPAIIFDLRNYPQGTGWTLINKLADELYVSAMLNKLNPFYPGAIYETPDLETGGGSFNPYNGRIIILCDQHTQSQAEYTVMKLQTFPDHKVIGTQTAGADGNVSILHLPDTLDIWFTSMEIFYPDSTQTQRVGVQIDSIVAPTIEGLRNGVDEILLAALDCITPVINSTQQTEFTITPNPASNYASLNFSNPAHLQTELVIRNMMGEIVLTQQIISDHETIDVSRFPKGIYLVELINVGQLVGNSKLIVMK